MKKPTAIAYNSKVADGFTYKYSYSVTIGKHYIVSFAGTSSGYFNGNEGYSLVEILADCSSNQVRFQQYYVQAISTTIVLGAFGGEVSCISVD